MNHKFLTLATLTACISIALSNVSRADDTAGKMIPEKISQWVTKVADTNDGICDQDCSLREAIAAAISNDGIGFSASFYKSNDHDTTATLVKQTIVLTAGELVINKDINIFGPGRGLTVTANRASRLVHVVNANAAISGLTFSGGQAFGAENGGVIINEGDLSLRNVGVFDGHTDASASGGGIWNSGNLSLLDSEISLNESGRGGGVFSTGSLSIDRSNVHDNIASNGGGVFAGELKAVGHVVITNSSIQHNAATDFGAGMYLQAQRSRVENTTVSGNVARERGAGIYFTSADSMRALQLINSTISGNLAGFAGAGVYSEATDVGGVLLEVTNCTIAKNRAGAGGGIITQSTKGATARSTIRNTILFQNIGGNLNVNGGNNEIKSGGFNLTDDEKSQYLTETTDLLASDPRLGELQNNGGKTMTHELGYASPAINAGFNFGYKTDQRGNGFFRTVGRPGNSNRYSDGTDIGAFEVQFVK
jgi:CSLREA domain-containing protein